MTKNNKREYDAPMVELIEARVEKGFQTSGATEEPAGTRGANEALTAGSSYDGYVFS